VVVPGHALILLIGPPGSGKSTFARRHFRPTEVLSSDAFRAMVADDESDQRATPAAFDLLHRAAVHRLTRARLTVIDATNLKRGDRRALLDLARRLGRPAVAILFALPAEVSLARNRDRSDRVVTADVVARAAGATHDLAAQPERLAEEGFRAVHVLRAAPAVDRVTIVREGRAPGRGATTAGRPAARSGARPGRTS
jgi:predicted kinase